MPRQTKCPDAQRDAQANEMPRQTKCPDAKRDVQMSHKKPRCLVSLGLGKLAIWANWYLGLFSLGSWYLGLLSLGICRYLGWHLGLFSLGIWADGIWAGIWAY